LLREDRERLVTDLRRSVTKRLMPGMNSSARIAGLSGLGINLAGYSVYDIKSLEHHSADLITTVFPGTTSEVAAPKPLGGTKELLTADLPAVAPAVYKNIEGKSGSSVFRHGKSALLPKDIYDGRNRVRMDNEHETCIVQGDQVALKRERGKKVEKGICAFSQGDSNWYHWLAEVLPTVLLSRNLPDAFDSYPLLVPEAALNIASFRDTLDLCRGERDVVPLQKSQLHEFGELVYIPPQVIGPFNVQDGQWPEPGHYRQNIEVMHLLRDTILKKLNITRTNDGPKRVFLARPPNTRSYNQSDIITAAQDRGFEPVYLEKLSFREQVQLMHNADYVVGPTGAAFTNTLFMHPDSHSLVWALREYAGACFFSNLAHVSNNNMTYCFVEADSPIVNSFQAFLASYKLPVEVFCHHIDALLEGAPAH
jgi:glycosyl transferase family 61